ncbi:cell surface metalloreductase (FreA) [Ilyonectria robusta]
MESTKIYSIALSSTFVLLLLLHYRHLLSFIVRATISIIYKASYIRLGPWNLLSILSQVLFAAVNVYLVFFTGLFRPVSISRAAVRSGNLGLINLVPLTAGPSQSFIADILGTPLKTFQKIHRCFGVISFLLIALHVGTSISASHTEFSLDVKQNRWAVIVSLFRKATSYLTACKKASSWLLLVLLLPLPRKYLYEFFVQSHQLAGVLLAIPIWQHLTPKLNMPLYFLLASFPLMLLVQLAILLFRNMKRWSLSGGSAYVEEAEIDRRESEGMVTITNLKDVTQKRLHVDNPIRLKRDILYVRLVLSRPVCVKEGQYIGLYIPTLDIGKVSFMQIHPFMVVSWADGAARHLDLVIEPRQGWTRKLLRYSKMHPGGTLCRAFFTGPYGVSVPTDNYAAHNIRENVRNLAREFVFDKVTLAETEYQPEQSEE